MFTVSWAYFQKWSLKWAYSRSLNVRNDGNVGGYYLGYYMRLHALRLKSATRCLSRKFRIQYHVGATRCPFSQTVVQAKEVFYTRSRTSNSNISNWWQIFQSGMPCFHCELVQDCLFVDAHWRKLPAVQRRRGYFQRIWPHWAGPYYILCANVWLNINQYWQRVTVKIRWLQYMAASEVGRCKGN